MSLPDGSTSIVSKVLSSTTEKIVRALAKTASAAPEEVHGDSSTMLGATNSPITKDAPSSSGWNSTEFSSSFLEHASGQGISGACAWAAIFITCHQVRITGFVVLGRGSKEGMKNLGSYCFINNIILTAFLNFILTDLPILTMVYKSRGTKMDCPDSFYSPNLCIRILAKSTLLQEQQILCIFQCST